MPLSIVVAPVFYANVPFVFSLHCYRISGSTNFVQPRRDS